MRKPYRQRRVCAPPDYQSFKPAGIRRRDLTSMILSIDEYEAIRLADYEGLEHVEAAEKMHISRPTFTRLVDKARKKVAKAIIEGMELVIHGGNVDFEQNYHHCRQCGEKHTVKYGESIDTCPDCGSREMEDLAEKYMGGSDNQN